MPDAEPPPVLKRKPPTPGEIALWVGSLSLGVVICLSTVPFVNRDLRGLLGLLSIPLTAAGNAVWITMDRERRGLETGPWRVLALIFGPAVLCVYILLEYKERALLYIPLLLLIYALTWVAPPMAAVYLHRIWS
jgi:hypothetical protein